MHPVMNLAIAIVVLTLAYLGLRPQAGWFWRLRHGRRPPERVEIEDCAEAALQLPGSWYGWFDR